MPATPKRPVVLIFTAYVKSSVLYVIKTQEFTLSSNIVIFLFKKQMQVGEQFNIQIREKTLLLPRKKKVIDKKK